MELPTFDELIEHGEHWYDPGYQEQLTPEFRQLFKILAMQPFDGQPILSWIIWFEKCCDAVALPPGQENPALRPCMDQYKKVLGMALDAIEEAKLEVTPREYTIADHANLFLRITEEQPDGWKLQMMQSYFDAQIWHLVQERRIEAEAQQALLPPPPPPVTQDLSSWLQKAKERSMRLRITEPSPAAEPQVVAEDEPPTSNIQPRVAFSRERRYETEP